MSAREVAEWAVFEGEFGPLTVQERLDQLWTQPIGSGKVEWKRPERWRSDVDWLTILAGR
jgi:hypothetical protein